MIKFNPLNFFTLLAIVASFSLCNAGPNSSTNESDTSGLAANYTLVEAFPNLVFDNPVELVSPNDNTDRIFLVEQKGRIRLLTNKADQKDAAVFLDIVSKVNSGGEKGLLGLAFHPNYESNGYFYVNYTSGNPLETIIARYKVDPSNPARADASSEQVLLRFEQPYENHNGGKVAFGNDGFLYVAVGDGGAGGDPGNRAQNKKELLGKILRIDVDRTNGNLPYGIPADNPFAANKEGFKEEIFAFGVRNPWRFSFDRKTGLLWAGDVGQNKIEEIDIIEKGGNYGWKIMEAKECYGPRNCNMTGLLEPIWSYEHGDAGNSVTGGYVCRDTSLPELAGKYIYGDFTSGKIWALTHDGKTAVKNEMIGKVNAGLSSFGEDSKSNLYLLSYGNGKIFRIASR